MAPLGVQWHVCILMRMPRMQVYLPEPLHAQVKARKLPVSELLQKALQAELRRLDLLAETDRYLADLIEEVGPPSPAQRNRADALARKITRRAVRKAG
jgi:post-segregation antitoxin (ccd killing protein)